MLDSMIEGGAAYLDKFFKFVFEMYNLIVGQAAGMLSQNPASWNTEAWQFVEDTSNVFMGTAAILVMIFFLMGFCADSIDVHQDLRLENMLRMFIKLGIAEFFVTNSLTVVKNLFALGTGFIGKLSRSSKTFQYTVPDEVSKILNKPLENELTGIGGLLAILVLFILAIMFLMIMEGCAFVILYEAYIRLFKILMLAPYGTLANSTLAGNRTLQHSAESFWKYALETILSAVTMYSAIVLSAVVISSGTLTLAKGWTGSFYIFGWMLESIFVSLLALGTVKGAEQLTQKVLGL